MRVLLGGTLAFGLAAAAGAAAAQSQPENGNSGAFTSPPGQEGNVTPGPTGPSITTPTRYETSLAILRAQMDRQARRDGGQLTLKHQAEFEQALDQTNRHFHKGPYAPQ